MKIGTIGAGEVAQAFARKALKAGHEVLLSNSRGPESLAPIVEALGPGASAGTRDAAAGRPVVLLTVPWARVAASLEDLPDWGDRILVDATNGLDRDGLVDVGDDGTSEIVARLAPGARVVKAINSSMMTNFGREPVAGDFRRALFVSSDHRGAAEEVANLLESLGFAPVYLGGLRSGGRMQAVGSTIAGHDFHLPWPAPREFPSFNGEPSREAGR